MAFDIISSLSPGQTIQVNIIDVSLSLGGGSFIVTLGLRNYIAPQTQRIHLLKGTLLSEYWCKRVIVFKKKHKEMSNNCCCQNILRTHKLQKKRSIGL